MRLLKVDSFFAADRSLKLQYFVKPPESYAILSHTWGEDEVLFEDISKGTAPQRSAYKKLLLAAEQASRDEFSYLWVDTCCIDKSSSAELQEAINSMFRYYQESKICYVYLEDVEFSLPVYSSEFEEEITASRWFTRGWTLQELIAPGRLAFVSQGWKLITDTMHWERQQTVDVLDRVMSLVTMATGVSERYLNSTNGEPLADACIALKMSWASSRHVTREEDIAYCLLGLFDVTMPLLYGEGGQKAFIRLQEEIMKHSDDHSLFAWTRASDPLDSHKYREIPPHGLLADHPSDFSNRGMAEALNRHRADHALRLWSDIDPYHLTSRGLQIRLPLQHVGGNVHRAFLDCTVADTNRTVAIYLIREDEKKPLFQRVFTGTLELVKAPNTVDPLAILVRQRPNLTHRASQPGCIECSFGVSAPTATNFSLCETSRRKRWEEAIHTSRPGTWATLGKTSFSSWDSECYLSLLIDDVHSPNRLIVNFGVIHGFFVGFSAYEAVIKDTIQEAPQSSLEFRLYEQNTKPLRLPGNVVDIWAPNAVYHVKVEVLKSEPVRVRVSNVGYAGHHFRLDLQLSIETSPNPPSSEPSSTRSEDPHVGRSGMPISPRRKPDRPFRKLAERFEA